MLVAVAADAGAGGGANMLASVEAPCVCSYATDLTVFASSACLSRRRPSSERFRPKPVLPVLMLLNTLAGRDVPPTAVEPVLAVVRALRTDPRLALEPGATPDLCLSTTANGAVNSGGLRGVIGVEGV